MTTFTNAFRLSGISVALFSCALFLLSLACTPGATGRLDQLSGGQPPLPCYSNQTVSCPMLALSPPATFCAAECKDRDQLGNYKCPDHEQATIIQNDFSYSDALPAHFYQLGRTGKKRRVDANGNPVDVYCNLKLTCGSGCDYNPIADKHFCVPPSGPPYSGTPGDKREPYEWSFEYGTWTCSVDNMFPAIDHLVAMIP